MAASAYRDAVILLTNDDGIDSPGLRILYESARGLGALKVIAPEKPRSASGHGMTLHRAVKARRILLWGSVDAVAIDGLPADAVYIALSTTRPSIVLSGINKGDNTSIQSIVASSTIGAAIHAAINGIPGLAFSIDVGKWDDILADKDYIKIIRRIVKKLVTLMLVDKALRKIGVVSINFPHKLHDDTIVLAAPARLRFIQRARIVGREGDTILYKIHGSPATPPRGSDVDLLFRGHIVATPICIDSIASCRRDLIYRLVNILEADIVKL